LNGKTLKTFINERNSTDFTEMGVFMEDGQMSRPLNREFSCSVLMMRDSTLFLRQDSTAASNGGGGSTVPSTSASGKKGKKSRGKESTDSGNGDAGSVENSEPVAKTRVVVVRQFLSLFEYQWLVWPEGQRSGNCVILSSECYI